MYGPVYSFLDRRFGISAEIGWAMKAKMVVQVDGIQKAFWISSKTLCYDMQVK